MLPTSKSLLERRCPSSERSEGDCAVFYLHPAKQGINYAYDESLGRPVDLTPVGVPAFINLHSLEVRELIRMADAWDKAHQGRGMSWWPVPPGW